MTNRMAGSGSLLPTRSTRFTNRSYHIEKMAKDLADTRHELWVTIRPILPDTGAATYGSPRRPIVERCRSAFPHLLSTRVSICRPPCAETRRSSVRPGTRCCLRNRDTT